MKILLWKIGALGDVLMTTPLVRQIRRAWPTARIDYLVGRSCAVMLRGNPHLDTLDTFDERVLYGGQAHRLPEIVRQLRGYDTAFVLDKHWIFALSTWTARVPCRVGFARRAYEGWLHTHRVSYGQMRHEIDAYLDLAEATGVAVDRSDILLELPPARPTTVPPSPYFVLINAGGNNAREKSGVRRLPEALFGSLVEHCAELGHVVFVGSADEAANYARWCSPRVVNLCGRLPLPEVWTILKHAAHIYTTDCGLMHMAAAVNAHVTAIFGPTNPWRLCPPAVRWVWHDKDKYDPTYEQFGRVPQASFFESLTLAEILHATEPSPFAERKHAPVT